jgi:hypothetical protein
MSEVLAKSVSQDDPHTVTFKVSAFFLEEARKTEWSGPVMFRFEERDGEWDLVMRRAEDKG